MAEKKKVIDTYSYKGWLISDKFLKRALAVLGYSIVGTLVIYIPLMVLLIILFLIFGGLFYLSL